ncbi:hypothetical protein [Xanthomonas arboricola]|uniref:hypothetical protein n=1 Tax=Xanthomonas arboricola TaxID=56448 RepID=UPI0012905601|nr:hypothetical protein [Xanthomonas arboricola]
MGIPKAWRRSVPDVRQPGAIPVIGNRLTERSMGNDPHCICALHAGSDGREMPALLHDAA